MHIKSLIIHEINKEVNSTTADMYLSDEALDIEDKNSRHIVDALDNAFNKKTHSMAKLSDNGFQSKIPNFTQYNLVEVSKDLATVLRDSIQSISTARGGYLVFAEYKKQHDFLAVFLVRNTQGTKLIQKGKSYDLDSTQYLDIEHFAMGVKINVSILQSNSDNRYVSLARGNTDIARYFENWVGLDDAKQENKDADALYEIANLIEPPINVGRDELKRKIFNFAKEHPTKNVNLRELSQFLYEDENIIPAYATTHNIDIDGEFKLSGQKLKKFYKISVKADNIELSAPRSSFNPSKINIDGDIVTIHSQALAQELQSNINDDK